MKITTYEQVSKEIELPKYFKIKGSPNYYMILDNQSLIFVRDYTGELDHTVNLYPKIERTSISYHSAIIPASGFDHISETEFKAVFLKVSLELEKLAN
jgi:hypothetical protein